jgi:hypothetical protein
MNGWPHSRDCSGGHWLTSSPGEQFPLDPIAAGSVEVLPLTRTGRELERRAPSTGRPWGEWARAELARGLRQAD